MNDARLNNLKSSLQFLEDHNDATTPYAQALRDQIASAEDVHEVVEVVEEDGIFNVVVVANSIEPAVEMAKATQRFAITTARLVATIKHAFLTFRVLRDFGSRRIA